MNIICIWSDSIARSRRKNLKRNWRITNDREYFRICIYLIAMRWKFLFDLFRLLVQKYIKKIEFIK